MGRCAGSHTYRNTLRTIYQQVGELDRKYTGFLFRFIKVGNEVHHILVQIRQKCLLGDLFQARLRITHGRSPVSFDIAEVSMSVYHGKPFFEILGHHHQRVIDGAVPVGMVFTHGITHDTSALPVRPVVTDSQLMHIIQGSALHRLQSVPHIRKGPGHDNAHGIIDKGFLHDLRIFCFYNLFFQFLLHPFLYTWRQDVPCHYNPVKYQAPHPGRIRK